MWCKVVFWWLTIVLPCFFSTDQQRCQLTAAAGTVGELRGTRSWPGYRHSCSCSRERGAVQTGRRHQKPSQGEFLTYTYTYRRIYLGYLCSAHANSKRRKWLKSFGCLIVPRTLVFIIVYVVRITIITQCLLFSGKFVDVLSSLWLPY